MPVTRDTDTDTNTNARSSSFGACIALLLAREVRTLRREIERYPDDAAPWREIPGLPNAGGTLALHLAGNLQHYVGAVLGGSGYRRDRDAEFARRDVPRAALLAEVDAALAAIERVLPALDDAMLDVAYPEAVASRQFSTRDFLLHLLAHLAYHVGQLDYHRRAATSDAAGVGAIAIAELPGLDAGR